MASLKIVFFKRPKIRVFSYTPRHWDPEKERLDERRHAIAREMGVALPEEAANPDAPYRSNIKGQIKRQFESGKRKKSKFMGGPLFILGMLMLLFVGAYFGSGLFEKLFTSINDNPQKEQVQQEEKRPRNEDTHFIMPLP